MNKLIPLTLLLLIAATGAEAARWKTGPGPAGAQTRATYPSGSCYWDTVDVGPDQCRYKALSATSCQFVQESGPNQCTPGTQPAPASEYVRFEGPKAHLHSYDGTLTFDTVTDASGAMTASWTMGADTVTMALTTAGMTVTRNGARVVLGTTASQAQMQAVSTMLTNSTAVTRFRLKAATKLATAKARSATTPISATARGVEDGFFAVNAFVDALTGDATAFADEAKDPAPGGSSQHDCVTDWEVAMMQYYTVYTSCVSSVFAANPRWYWWLPNDSWFCAMGYHMRTEMSLFQMLACAAIPRAW